MNEFSTPVGWYPDGDGWERRWDGTSWTEERRRMPEPTQVRPAQTAEPVAPAQPAPSPQGQPAQGPPPQGQPPQGPPPQGPPPGHPAAGVPSYGHIPSTGLGAPPPNQPPPNQPAPRGPMGPGGPAGPGGYGYGPPPGAGGPRKSRLWLWITLGVALVVLVGGGIGLAIAQPWSDDSPSAKDGDGDGDDKPGPAIQGDINGDGKGDVVYYVRDGYDKARLVTAASNGNGFDLNEIQADPRVEPNNLHIDWDNDGVNEPLTWSFVEPGQLTLSSSDSDFPQGQIFTFSLATLKEYGGVEIQVVSGDFDGDGDVDLAVAGPNNKTVDVAVLANDGSGTFAAPVMWLSIPNASMDVLKIYAGDFDNNKTADIWAQLPADRLDNEDYTRYYSGDRGFALLKSTGSAFELGAVNDSRLYFERMLAGDITGDGTTHIIGLQSNSIREELTVTVFDVSSGQFKEVKGFTGVAKIGQRSLSSATLSDVNGDGKADLVFVVKGRNEAKFTGIQVMTSTGAVFEQPLVWAETSECVEQDCRIQFEGTPRY